MQTPSKIFSDNRVTQKMQHSAFLLKSVPEVRFNFSTCVSESEFLALSI